MILRKWCKCGDEKSRLRADCWVCRQINRETGEDRFLGLDILWVHFLLWSIKYFPINYGARMYQLRQIGISKIAELKHLSVQTIHDLFRKKGILYYLD